jgi:hypothetical protein
VRSGVRESGSGWGGGYSVGGATVVLGAVVSANQRRGQTSLGWHRGDVGGLASSCTGVEAEWAGEGSLGFPWAVWLLMDANVQRRIGPGKMRER